MCCVCACALHCDTMLIDSRVQQTQLAEEKISSANYDGIWTLAQLISVESNVSNPIQSEFNCKMQSRREQYHTVVFICNSILDATAEFYELRFTENLNLCMALRLVFL